MKTTMDQRRRNPLHHTVSVHLAVAADNAERLGLQALANALYQMSW